MLTAALSAAAQQQLTVDSIRLARNGQLVQLAIDVTTAPGNPPRSAITIITPRLVGEADSLDFPPIIALGRQTWYHDLRQGTQPAVMPADAFRIRHKHGPTTEHYARTVAHQPWMENSTLKLIYAMGTPCGVYPLATETLQGFVLPPPDTTIVEHRNTEQDELTGSVSGQARIQFIVNRTDFNPDLSNNKRELQSMHQSILDVQSNPDVRITEYRIKGYASPEGSYANNVRLAQGRTEQLRRFMVDEWGVPAQQVIVDYEPEDWVGFRQYVEEHRSEYKDADAILAIIDDSSLDPDPRLARIAARHPASYKRLLAECFPQLRRTDYSINYDWLRIEERQGAVIRDTTIVVHQPKTDDPLEPDVYTTLRPTRPWAALKTNLLFDLALTPNVEVELPLGRDSRWSVMVEDWFPWYLYRRNNLGLGNKYRRPGSGKPYRNAYEVWVLGAELRYWFAPPCIYRRPTLTGTFLGIYAAGGKYDWERSSTGDQGEFTSLGVTLGHSWAIARKLNLELSASAGYVGGPRRHYVAEEQFQDNRLIWKYSGRLRYYGPTKLKLSLVWLLSDKPSRKKGKEARP